MESDYLDGRVEDTEKTFIINSSKARGQRKKLGLAEKSEKLNTSFSVVEISSVSMDQLYPSAMQGIRFEFHNSQFNQDNGSTFWHP